MRSLILAMSLLLFAQALAPAYAAVTGSDLINAINKRQFLPAGTPVNARIAKDHAFVSTYRHSEANENDCKIDAVLIAKAVVETAPDVSRVTTFFYGQDPGAYQEVSVTAGDLQAFGAGSTSQEKLLSSLAISTVKTQSEEDKVARQLESSWIARPSDYKVTQDKDGINVLTGIDPWVSDEESRIEALRIAMSTHRVQPSVQQIKISLVDPDMKADTREFVFKAGVLSDLWKSIQSPLSQIALQRKPVTVDLQTVTAARGPQQDARESLLTQLKEMDKKGIGVAPFVKAFFQIEQAVKREADAAAIATMVTRLKTSVDDQLKAYASAKDKPKVAAQPASVPAPVATAPPKGKRSNRWAVGNEPIIEGEVLADPDELVERFSQDMTKGFLRAEDNPKYVKLLEQVVTILQKNNRTADASRFQAKINDIQAHRGKQP